MAALSHVKSNTIGDFTGTVTVLNSQGSTTTAAATDLVRPGDWNSAHNFFQTISGNTGGDASTASGTNLVIGGTNGFGVSMSTAAGAATMWVGNPVHSGYNPYADIPLVAGQLGQATLQFEPEEFPQVQFDRLCFPVNFSGATNSTATLTVSAWWGLYSRNVSSLSLVMSTSISTTLGHSGTGAGSWTLHSGMRLLTVPMTTTVTAGDYWVGLVSRTSTSSQNVSISNMLGSNINSNFVGIFGASHNTTYQMTLGQGVYSATTSGMPGSVAFTQIRGSDSIALRAPVFMMASGTI